MAVFCSNCRTSTGRHRAHSSEFNEVFLEMDHVGSSRVEGKNHVIFQCPRCDLIKARVTHNNGMTTTKVLTSDEVENLPSGSGLLGALTVLGVMAVGAAILTSGGSDDA